MADDNECDVVSNGEVFDDVDSDPGSMINNVESCSKILIPSMAQHSMSKLSGGEHEENESPDGIFQNIKRDEGDDDDTSDQNNDDENHIKPDSEKSRRLSVNSPRAVKWSLETMAAAMDSVFSGELTTTNAARKFQIPRTTLLDRLSMKAKRQHLEAPGTFPLNPESDAQIVEFVRRNESVDKSTLIKGMLSLAEDLARMQGRPFENALCTRKWLKLFVQKHPNLDILKYSRTRTASARSSVTMAPPSLNIPHRKTSISSAAAAENVLSASQLIQIQQFQTPLNSTLSANLNSNDISDHEKSPSPNEEDNKQNIFDSLESSLARQGAKAIEQRLTAEQLHYFKYRFISKNLERGFELWKLCKSQADRGDNLSVLALNGVEQGLSQEHLKYFQFRYENEELEEGYKLWSFMTEKIYLHE